MSDAHGRTLYATLDQSRFFHVPPDIALPEGGLPVRTLSGERVDIDPDAWAAYEVDEAAAKNIVKEQLGSFMDFAGQAIGQLQNLASKFQAAQQELDELAGGERAEKRKANLADALQINPDTVDDPAQVMRGLNALMQRMQAKMADPEELKKAGVRESIREDLQKLGSASVNQATGEADAAVEDARAALLEIFGSDETREALRSATSELKRVRSEMEEAGAASVVGPSGNRPDPDEG